MPLGVTKEEVFVPIVTLLRTKDLVNVLCCIFILFIFQLRANCTKVFLI